VSFLMKKRRPSTRTTAARPGHARRARAARPSARAGQPQRASGGASVKLPPECTLAHADGLKVRLAAVVSALAPVAIDVCDVRRIDTASMQVLVAFVRARSAAALPVRLQGDSAVFNEAVRLLGLASVLAPCMGPKG
jgi:ABC-type transporter Mla MlaB component